MALLVLSSKLFMWHKTYKLFTAYASELRLQYINGEWGFYMESHRTGKLLWFKMVKEQRDPNGVVNYVEFASKDPDLQLRVFNNGLL